MCATYVVDEGRTRTGGPLETRGKFRGSSDRLLCLNHAHKFPNCIVSCAIEFARVQDSSIATTLISSPTPPSIAGQESPLDGIKSSDMIETELNLESGSAEMALTDPKVAEGPCVWCGVTKTPLWRSGPEGPRTLWWALFHMNLDMFVWLHWILVLIDS